MNFDEIRAVLFDLDGTLYRQAPLRALMALELATMPLSGPLSAPRRWRALMAFRDAQERLRGRSGALGPGAQAAVAAEAVGLPVAEVEDLVDEWIMRRPLKYLPFCREPGLEKLLDALDRAGRPAGVLSDYPAQAKLEAMGVGGRFSPVLSATDPEIAAFKPSPRGYLRACEVWSLEPSEVLFVGDRAEVDAAGARAAGMRCVILGTEAAASGADYVVFDSLGKLSHVLDRRP
jgi:FMN phosphatase YigB (HAD superfamily)